MIREALTLERLRGLGPDEAAALLVGRRAEGLTPSEEGLLIDWLGEDEANARALDRADRAWAAFGDSDGDEILNALRAHALRPQARRWTDWRHLAAAAVLLLIVGSGILLVAAPWRSGPGADSAIDYATGRGQVREIALADGSTMTLDAESAASVRFGARERSVSLTRGRALFEVSPDAARPFAVTTATRRIVAVGTRFEVNVRAGAFSVFLLHGRVTVGPLDGSARPVMLNPGQRFEERGGARLIRTAGTASENGAGWRRGLIDFDDISLSEAVAEVNLYSRDQLVIRDSRVGAMRISGQFRAGEAERFARTVAEVHPVRVVRRGNGIELLPAR